MDQVLEIATSIAGTPLRAQAVGFADDLSAGKTNVYRDPVQHAGSPDLLEYLRLEQKIGAHSLVDIGLSGAFAFFLLRKTTGKPPTGKTSTVGLARLEYWIASHPDCYETIMDVVNHALGAVGYSCSCTNKRNFKRFMVSFNGISRPNSHYDQSKYIDPNFFRLIWDFHPRGRIISFANKKQGLFLENCGHEFCSQTMCGNVTLTDRSSQRLLHQGWDCRERVQGCALVTAILDMSLNVNFTELIAVLNEDEGSTLYQQALTNKMKTFVDIELSKMMNDENENLTEATLSSAQQTQNEVFANSWGVAFENEIGANIDAANAVDQLTNEYLLKRFRFLSSVKSLQASLAACNIF